MIDEFAITWVRGDNERAPSPPLATAYQARHEFNYLTGDTMTTHSNTTAPGPSEVEGLMPCAPPEGTPSGTLHRILTPENIEVFRYWDGKSWSEKLNGNTCYSPAKLPDWRYLGPVAPYVAGPAGEVTEAVAAACWPWLRYSLSGVEYLDWASVNAGSAAHEIAYDMARAALEATLSRAQPSVDKIVSDAEKSELTEIATTSRGYTIFREPNEAGGHRYWSDSIGGGVVVWDTCLASPEELEVAMRCERERTSAARPSDGGWQDIVNVPRDQFVDLWHRDNYRLPDCHYTVNRKRHGGRLETGWVDQEGNTWPESAFTHFMIPTSPTTSAGS